MGCDDRLPDVAEARANIERAARAWREGKWAVFRIADAATDEVVGAISLRCGDNDTAEISYFLRASARGRRLATRAVRLVTRWAFDELAIERIELHVHPENASSRRVAERAGFRREGVERAASRAWPDGTRFDSIVSSLLRTDPQLTARDRRPHRRRQQGDRERSGVADERRREAHYDRAQFERAWIPASGGIVYVIRPAGWPMASLTFNNA